MLYKYPDVLNFEFTLLVDELSTSFFPPKIVTLSHEMLKYDKVYGEPSYPEI